jgi:hypothetical protein
MNTRKPAAVRQAFRDKGGTLRARDLIAVGMHTDPDLALVAVQALQ